MTEQNVKEKQNEMLKIRVEGVVQQWSKEGWVNNVLKTEPIPTKKGVVDLCGIALGIRPWWSSEREQEIEELSNQIKLYYSPDESEEGTIYDDSFYLEDVHHRKKIKYKQQIIVDADFVMYISADAEILKKLYKALREPVYMLFLGNNDCPPGRMISEGYVVLGLKKKLIEIKE